MNSAVFVAGPRLAQGYYDRREETDARFVTCSGSSGSEKTATTRSNGAEPPFLPSQPAPTTGATTTTRWFDTSDLAFCDHATGVYYVVGRANDDGEHSLSYSSWGKVNGVAVHTSEMEQVFAAALTKVLARRRSNGTVGVRQHACARQ